MISVYGVVVGIQLFTTHNSNSWQNDLQLIKVLQVQYTQLL